MKKTQRKDAVRNILRSKVSYLSIVIIAALAVAAYLGISFAAEALRTQASNFYAMTHFRDAEVLSTMLLSEDDLNTIRALAEVADAEGAFTTSGEIISDGEKQSVVVVSRTERINTPFLLEGRQPEAVTECLLEQTVADSLGVKPGDTVHIEKASYLLCDTYTVAGIVYYPDYYSMPNVIIAPRCVVVLPDAFDRDALEGCYMKAEVRFAATAALPAVSKAYLDAVRVPLAALTEIAGPSAALREASIRGRFQSEIDEGQAKLNDAKQELLDGRAELDEKTQEAADGEQKLLDAEAELRDAAQQIADGEAQLADGEAQLKDAWEQLEAAKAELASAEAELEDGRNQLNAARWQLNSSRSQLDSAKQQLDSGSQQLIDSYNQIETLKSDVRDLLKDTVDDIYPENTVTWAQASPVTSVDDPNMTAMEFAVTDTIAIDIIPSMDELVDSSLSGIVDLSDPEVAAKIESIKSEELYETVAEQYDAGMQQLKQWDDAHADYLAGREAYQSGEEAYNTGYAQYQYGQNRYNNGLAQYNEGKAQYEAGLAEYEENLALFEEKKAELEDAKAQYAEGLQKLEDGKKELADGKAQLAEGEQKYADGVLAYEDGVRQLDDAKAQLDALGTCRWVVLDVHGNGSYIQAEASAENIDRLSITFALLFVVVGELVIYATVGRMIEDQRKLLGTTKALGFFNREIALKYILYGVSGTLLGILVGILLGAFGIQPLITYAHSTLYVYPKTVLSFLPLQTVLVVVLGTLLSAFAVWFACARLVKAPARELMQDRAPQRAPRGKGGKRSILPLYSRLILRNLRSDRRRVLITIVSVAGSCTLLMIGFTLQHGIDAAIDRQFSQIQRYEQIIRFDSDVSASAEADIEAILAQRGAAYSVLRTDTVLVDTDDGLEASFVFSGSTDAIAPYYTLQTDGSGQPLTLPESGMLIHLRMSETKNWQIGDTVPLFDAEMNPHTATVAGVYENYFGRNLFLSEAGYTEVFGKPYQPNTIWTSGCGDGKALEAALRNIEGFVKIESIEETRSSAQKIASVLTLVTLVMIVAAGMMAVFILLNLTNMALTQKNRELTIMRINGFTTKEVIRYMSREMVLTTVLGIVLGLVLGGVLGVLIVRFLEQVATHFAREIPLSGVALSILLTAGFSFCINAFALRKVKRLKLTDL